MTQQPQVFYSNRLEILYEGLRDSLFAQGISPFARRMLIVPSRPMGTWLQLRLAKDPDCGIAAGLEIGLIEESLAKLSKQIIFPNGDLELPKFPRDQELSFLFEAGILDAIKNFTTFTKEEQQIWQPLLQYLKALPVYQPGKSEKRLIALCDSLADLFAHYGRYGVKMLGRWEETNTSESWQAKLWNQIKVEHPSLQFHYQHLHKAAAALNSPQTVESPRHLQVHLFGISFIAQSAHDFLMQVGAHIPVHYYLLSPCQMFWSDLCSDKESSRLKAFWANQSISISQQEALEDFLNDRNALLGNFGRMGREMSQQIEQSLHQTTEVYILPEAVQNHSQYADIVDEEVLFETAKSPLTLLQAIQADMTLLRTIESDDKIDLSYDDRSIQLHVAPTKQREVEILYNVLVGLLDKHSKDIEPLVPSDIIVMVPDYMQYEPIIASIFGAKESLLDYQLVEMRAAAKSSLVQGFLHLLSIASSRWEVKELLDLLDFSAFQRKQGFSFEDRRQIEKWVEKSGVYWGKTAEHRNSLMEQAHGKKAMVDTASTGTWDYSCSRLLLGAAVEAEVFESSSSASIPPLEGVESSQIGLLSQWIQLLNHLADDLKPIHDNASMTLADWSKFLLCLIEAYFQIDYSDTNAIEDRYLLVEKIESLEKCEEFLGQRAFSFASIGERLKKVLNEQHGNFQEMHLQTVKFCPLLPMRALPAKVIVMLGMQEETFPRKDQPFSLNEMVGDPDIDYSPSQVDFDRYLFLEALLSARQNLILSYVGYSFSDNKECAPSLLVQELFDYADEGYLMGQKSPSEHCKKIHPFESFDSAYFSIDSDLKCYEPEQYKLALSYYTPSKSYAHCFFPETALISSGTSTELIYIKELITFASNPLKSYFNKTLGIYLKNDEEREASEPFALNALEKYQMRIEGIEKSFDHLIDHADKRGKLPPGMFKTLAVDGLQSDIKQMHSNFTDVGVDPKNIYTLVFSEHCEMPHLTNDKVYMLPPLIITDREGRPIKILGKLKQVTAAGLLYHQDKDFKSLVKIWPQALILQCAIEQFQLPIAPHAVSSKLGKPIIFALEDAAGHLANFIDYYHLGLKSPSLLIPEWVETIMEGNLEALEKVMQAAINDPFTSFYNEYVIWLFRDLEALSNPHQLMENWGPIAREQFSGLLNIANSGNRKTVKQG